MLSRIGVEQHALSATMQHVRRNPTDMAGAAPPRHARPFVALFLTVLVACPLGLLNLWPFSSWRLFSSIRTDRETSWEAVAVEPSGRERDVPVASFPHGYRGFRFVLAGFSKRAPAARNAICAAWLTEANDELITRTRLVRIYRLQWRLSDRRGERSAPGSRTLAWVCNARGAHEVG
jgi:hypothetical protein